MCNNKWQNISSAPKDGTSILWCADNGEFTRQRWSYSVIRWPEYEECFEDGWWLPLPPSPNCERKDDDAATRQQIDVDRGSERRGNERLHPGDTGGSDTVAVSTDVRPVAPAPAESGEPKTITEAVSRMGRIAGEIINRTSPPDLEGLVERLVKTRNDLSNWRDSFDPTGHRQYQWLTNAIDDIAEAADLLIAMRDERERFKQAGVRATRLWLDECEVRTNLSDELTAARAEIEALAAHNNKLQDGHAPLLREIDRLREEKATVTRIMNERNQTVMRFREALEKIANCKDDVPHSPAAFINAISEEGTKDEAIGYLHKEWNVRTYLQHIARAALKGEGE